MEAARKLTVTDGAVVTRMGYDLTRWTDGASSAAQDFVVFLWQNGGEFIDPVTFMPRFHEREGVETMTFLRDLMTTVRPPGHTVDPGQGSGSPIVRGTAAMNLNIGGVVAEAYRADERVAGRAAGHRTAARTQGAGQRHLYELARNPRRQRQEGSSLGVYQVYL